MVGTPGSACRSGTSSATPSSSASTTTASCGATRTSAERCATRSTTSSATCPLVMAGGLGLAAARQQAAAGRGHLPGDVLPARRHELGRRRAAVALAAQPERRDRQLAARPSRHRRAPAGGPTATWAMPSVILASAWKDLGFVMVILLAGLQAIDRDALRGGTDRRRRRVAAAALASPSRCSPRRCSSCS